MGAAHCSFGFCPGYAEYRGKCKDHARKAEKQRGTPTQRGYNSSRWKASRTAVLRRDPLCTCDDGLDCHAHARCMSISDTVDHYPRSRKQLLAEGVLDPDHPSLLRGLCHTCHSKHTAAEQPGGWNAR